MFSGRSQARRPKGPQLSSHEGDPPPPSPPKKWMGEEAAMLEFVALCPKKLNRAVFTYLCIYFGTLVGVTPACKTRSSVMLLCLLWLYCPCSFAGIPIFISSKMPDKPFYNHSPGADYHLPCKGDTGNADALCCCFFCFFVLIKACFISFMSNLLYFCTLFPFFYTVTGWF